MGVFRKLLIGFAALAGTLGLGIGIASAASDAVIHGTTNNTIYKTAQTITITGTVNGDIFCAAQNVSIDAIVNGDVICAGQTVTIHGEVHGDVRAAGQTVNVGAKVDHNVTVTAQDVTLDGNGVVGRDVGIAAQTANVDSSIMRDLKATANTLTISSPVGRNVSATVNKLNLNSGAKIAGTLDYTSPNTLHKASGVTVGETYYHKSQTQNHHINWTGVMLLLHLYWVLAVLVFAMVLVALFPQLFVRINEYGQTHVGTSILTGFVAMLLMPILFIALLVSIIGVPLAFALMLVWLLILMLSAPVASFYVGSLVLRNETRAPLIMLCGLAILGLIGLIPIIGWLVDVVAIWFGVGALLLKSRNRYERPNYTV